VSLWGTSPFLRAKFACMIFETRSVTLGNVPIFRIFRYFSARKKISQKAWTSNKHQFFNALKALSSEYLDKASSNANNIKHSEIEDMCFKTPARRAKHTYKQKINLYLPIYRESFCRAVFLGVLIGDDYPNFRTHCNPQA